MKSFLFLPDDMIHDFCFCKSPGSFWLEIFLKIFIKIFSKFLSNFCHWHCGVYISFDRHFYTDQFQLETLFIISKCVIFSYESLFEISLSLSLLSLSNLQMIRQIALLLREKTCVCFITVFFFATHCCSSIENDRQIFF